jgi:hypothetical protein
VKHVNISSYSSTLNIAVLAFIVNSAILLYNFEHVVTTIWDQNTNMDGSVKPLELNTTFDSYDELKESVDT